MGKTDGVRCPACGEEMKDLRGLNGHLRFKHGYSSERITEVLEKMKDVKEARTSLDELFDLQDKLQVLRERKERAEAMSRSGFLTRDVTADRLLRGLEVEESLISKRLREIQGPDAEEEEESEDEGGTFLV